MANLQTQYMGLSLKNPVVPSASPLSRNLDDIKKMEDAGAAAVVMYSLFEEQVSLETGELSEMLFQGTMSLAEASVYFPHRYEYPRDPSEYVEHIQAAKEAVSIPVIASMNGTSKGGWLEYASKFEEAGADALELNVYYIPTTDTMFGLDIETLYLDILKAVKKRVSIPVAMKLSPFFSSLPNFAVRLDETGMDGLVLFNRFYQPDFDVEGRQILPSLSLSKPQDILLPLRWIAILYGQVDSSLALTSGVHSANEVLKAIMAGADVANVCSVLLKDGIEQITVIIDTLKDQMDQLEIESIQSVKGCLSLQEYVEPSAFERASYIKLLQSFGRI
jgi:dihydroorotate dehydrogenase (fumarate)